MNREQAMASLLLYRPGSRDAQDPEVAAALELAKRDPVLSQWLAEHCGFQERARAAFRDMAVPGDLRDSLLAQSKIVRLPQASATRFWRTPTLWAAAAAIVLLIGLAATWLRPRAEQSFYNFEARMVSTALREYRMDVLSSDLAEVRSFMETRGAPANFRIPGGLGRLELTGGGLLKWRGNPVSMVCFNRGDQEMLYLFVLNRSAVKDPPPSTPRLHTVRDLAAVHWTEGENVYVLAGPPEPGFTERYL